MERILAIDYSVLSYQAFFGMKSSSWECRTNVEVQEYARGLAHRLYYLKQVIQPTKVIMAMDSYPIWRNKVYDDYYKKNTKYFKCNYTETSGENVSERECYLLEYDKKVYSVYFSKIKDEWICHKPKKADLEIIMSGDVWQYVESEEVDPDTQISMTELPENMSDFLPAYKGNRKDAKWPYSLTKKEYKELSGKIVKNISGLMCDDVDIVYGLDAEADDVLTYYINNNSEKDVFMYTVDTDLDQLAIRNMFLKIVRPKGPDSIEIVDRTVESIKYDLMKKILAGDSSDNIAGVSLKDKSTCLSDKGAEKFLTRFEDDTSKIYPALKEEADSEPLERNLKLIYLDNIPEYVKGHIQESLDNPIKPKDGFNWKDFGLEDSDMLTLRSKAKEDRKELELEN